MEINPACFCLLLLTTSHPVLSCLFPLSVSVVTHRSLFLASVCLFCSSRIAVLAFAGLCKCCKTSSENQNHTSERRRPLFLPTESQQIASTQRRRRARDTTGFHLSFHFTVSKLRNIKQRLFFVVKLNLIARNGVERTRRFFFF